MTTALAEPDAPVRASWISLLVVANLAVWMGFFTPIQVLLPEQIQAIAPDDKTTMLGWVTGLGALAAVVANPLAGALSDRTTGRYGRRHPWTLGGGLIGAVGLVAAGRSAHDRRRRAGWIAVQICFNAMLAALTAAVPDRVPVPQRGAVSGWIGMPAGARRGARHRAGHRRRQRRAVRVRRDRGRGGGAHVAVSAGHAG